MMAAKRIEVRLMDRLPPVRGRLTERAPLDRVTWFRVGGPAEVMFRPADADDLAAFLVGRPADVPVTVLGVGSNVLIRDGGVPGVVIRLGKGFAEVAIDGATVRAGAAALDANVALAAQQAGVAGLEFLSGVPGTVGGALRMNAGAYGKEMKDIVASARAVDMHGTIHALDPAELGFGYRTCMVPEGWIFIDAELRGRPGGSTFANPTGAKAWELIDRAGCRGLKMGGAMVSEMHTNFLINTGDATAADIEALGEEVRRRVRETSGVTLEWEIRRIGVPATKKPREVAP